MNSDSSINDPLVEYYDSDHPWPEDVLFAAAKLDPFEPYTLNEDIDFAVFIAEQTVGEGRRGRILDLCCGSGRLTVPLARAGHHVEAVDVSPVQITRLKERLAKEPPEVAARVTATIADVTTLEREASFDCVLIGYNSFSLICSARGQQNTMAMAAHALKPGGLFVADLFNPLTCNLQGYPHGTPIMQRDLGPEVGSYIKFMKSSAMDGDQIQTVTGWYDIVDAAHRLSRKNFSVQFRYIFPNEFRLMAESVGLDPRMTASTFSGLPYNAHAPKLLCIAKRPESG
ncbi:MAG: class I SAM-dependent methyltransferase [Beijerinckiaceae bacterium]